MLRPSVRTRRADGDPVGWAAGLGENHHRGEARAAVEARAKGAGAGGSRSLSAGGWGTGATAGWAGGGSRLRGKGSPKGLPDRRGERGRAGAGSSARGGERALP